MVLHCSVIQFSFTSFILALMFLLTVLHCRAAARSDNYFLSSLLLSHRSSMSSVTHGLFFFLCFLRTSVAVSWSTSLMLSASDFMSPCHKISLQHNDASTITKLNIILHRNIVVNCSSSLIQISTTRSCHQSGSRLLCGGHLAGLSSVFNRHQDGPQTYNFMGLALHLLSFHSTVMH